MKRLHSLTLVGAVVIASFVMGGMVQAMPFANAASVLKNTTEETSVIEQVHACNRVCQRGPVEEWGGAVRWHRHVGKVCRPVHCAP
jgi:hypothetical protein